MHMAGPGPLALHFTVWTGLRLEEMESLSLITEKMAKNTAWEFSITSMTMASHGTISLATISNQSSVRERATMAKDL